MRSQLASKVVVLFGRWSQFRSRHMCLPDLESDDLFAIAEDDGSGSHTSKHLTGENLKHGITRIDKNSQTTNYTLALTDRDRLVEMDLGTSMTLTVPTNAVVGFDIGTQILIVQKGAGQVTISGD